MSTSRKNDFLDCARKMPFLYHTLPNEKFDIQKSEVIEWLVRQPSIRQKIFEMAKSQKLIEYDGSLKKWKGIDTIVDDVNWDRDINGTVDSEITYDIGQDFTNLEYIGFAIYAMCLKSELNLESFFESLNEYNVEISDLKKHSLNNVVVYASSCVLDLSLYDHIRDDNEVITFLIEQLSNTVDPNVMSITAEYDENGPIFITAIIDPDDEERIIIEAMADVGNNGLETMGFAMELEYADEQITEELHSDSAEHCMLLDRFFRKCPNYKYIEDDYKRICRNSAREYVLKLTEDGTINWEWNGEAFVSTMGEEQYWFTYDSNREHYILEIVIEDRLTINSEWDKNEFKQFNRVINMGTSEDPEESKEIIGVEDFLVRATNYSCVHRSHSLQRVHAIVNIMRNGRIKEVRVEAAYCPDCDKYYILENDYLALKRQGVICCKVIEFSDLSSNKQAYMDLQERSILRIYGYTVSKSEGLTKQERRQILDFVMENGIMTGNQIISFLSWQIETRQRMWNMQDAISKWEDDIQYVRQYQYLNKAVRVRRIFTKRNGDN